MGTSIPALTPLPAGENGGAWEGEINKSTTQQINKFLPA